MADFDVHIDLEGRTRLIGLARSKRVNRNHTQVQAVNTWRILSE
jgi:hypothetical protein